MMKTDIMSLSIFEIDPNLKKLLYLKEKYIHFNKEYGNNYINAKEKLNDIIDEYYSCPYPMFHKIADLLSSNYEAIINSFIMIEDIVRVTHILSDCLMLLLKH